MELGQYEQNICEAAKLRVDWRLVNLLSSSESKTSGKVTLLPPVASVKHCPINLLQERCSSVTEVWPDRETFYLGTDCERSHEGERPVLNRRCPQRRPATALTYSFSVSNENMEVNYAADVVRPGYFHADRLLQASLLRKKYLNTKRDWILIQRLEKKACYNETTLHYHERGQPEFIFCVRDLLTVIYVEDISCQHFLQMNREESLESGYDIELLFSSHGPLVRNDKYIQGRSLLYFCCIKNVTASRKFTRNFRRDNSRINTCEDERIKNYETMEDSYQRKNHSAQLDTTDLEKEQLVPFPLTCRSSNASNSLNENNFSSSQSDSNANSKRHKRSLNSSKGNEQPKKASSKSNLRTMSPSRSQNCDQRSLASPTLGVTIECDLAESSTGPKSPTPSSNCQSDIENEGDKVKFEKKRRLPPTRRRGPRLSDASAIRCTYRIKKRKATTISVSLDSNDFSTEFQLHHSLQDLYTWMRQQLLQNELLKPGCDFLLSSKKESSPFPLKPNTATKVLSSLQCTSFICQIFLKSADSGLRGAASKYDTRFSLPLDTRQLEGLTPAQYLQRYCIVSSTWMVFYKSVFKSYDKMHKKSLSYKEIGAAMEKLFVEFAPALLEKVTQLMGFDTLNGDEDDWKTQFSIGPDEFVSVCCLANRILCQEDIVGGFHANTIKQNETHLEDADFFNIEGKLRDLNLNPLTRNLLLYIRNRPKC